MLGDTTGIVTLRASKEQLESCSQGQFRGGRIWEPKLRSFLAGSSKLCGGMDPNGGFNLSWTQARQSKAGLAFGLAANLFTLTGPTLVDDECHSKGLKSFGLETGRAARRWIC